MKIIILDSGLRADHSAFKNTKMYGYSLSVVDDCVVKKDDFADTIGHGTAVFHIISKKCPEAEIKVIKIFENEFISEDDLYLTLEYLMMNEEVDIINMSLGINKCTNYKRFKEICNEITNRGTLIVSAFDNSGAISYPAAFDCVIGVDSRNYIKNDLSYEYIENSIVNVCLNAEALRLAWLEPDYIIAGGASFACAHMTAIIANQKLKEVYDLAGNAASIRKLPSIARSISEKPRFTLKKAAIFPFNKEMHSILRFSSALDFQIESIYDLKYSGKIGASTRKILNDMTVPEMIIKDVKILNWEEIDTLIIGHTDELKNLARDQELTENLINAAMEHNINIFSFDPIKIDYKNYYYPMIDKADIPNNFGKLYHINPPVLGVLGTSSKQGKFTLQLILRQKLKKLNYAVGQLGSEPSALLYGMDEVFHYGYNRSIEVNETESVSIINDKMQKIAEKDYEIIIAGSQSGTVPYVFTNVEQFPISSLTFLYGVNPDAVILAINSFDNMDYLKRTISFIENTIESSVIALSLFPMKLKDGYFGLFGAKTKLSKTEIEDYKNIFFTELKRPVFELGNEKDMDKMVSLITNFFST